MNQNLIIIDDDEPFRERLARSMEKRGFIVEAFGSANKAKECLKEKIPIQYQNLLKILEQKETENR